MVDIKEWMELLTEKAEALCGDRIRFIGLQGSYGRGEATENSDIDAVLIFKEFNCREIDEYEKIISSMPYKELVCGFVSGEEELRNWDKGDLFQFYYDTTPVKGRLEEIIDVPGYEAAKQAVKTGACNIYHGCVHNLLHEKSSEVLRSLFKGAVFVIQALNYVRTGEYVKSKSELMKKADYNERLILELSDQIRNRSDIDGELYEIMSHSLICWSRGLINGNHEPIVVCGKHVPGVDK